MTVEEILPIIQFLAKSEIFFPIRKKVEYIINQGTPEMYDEYFIVPYSIDNPVLPNTHSSE